MLTYVFYAICLAYVALRVIKRGKTPSFAGQTVWITGASSGIGRALAFEFSRYGASLVLSSRSEAKLLPVRDRCTELGSPSIELVAFDLADQKEALKLGKEVSARKAIDVLVLCAGLGQRSLVEETCESLKIEEQLLTVNSLGPIALTKGVLPSMLQRQRGHIVGINSIQGLVGVPMRSAYSASKFALKTFLLSVRMELYFKGVNVTNIYPGHVQTEFSANALDEQNRRSGVPDENSKSAMSAEKFASKAVRSIYWKESEVIISSVKFRIAVFLRDFCPSLLSILQKNYLNSQLQTRSKARQKSD